MSQWWTILHHIQGDVWLKRCGDVMVVFSAHHPLVLCMYVFMSSVNYFVVLFDKIT